MAGTSISVEKPQQHPGWCFHFKGSTKIFWDDDLQSPVLRWVVGQPPIRTWKEQVGQSMEDDDDGCELSVQLMAFFRKGWMGFVERKSKGL